jgi:hypothetical protein
MNINKILSERIEALYVESLKPVESYANNGYDPNIVNSVYIGTMSLLGIIYTPVPKHMLDSLTKTKTRLDKSSYPAHHEARELMGVIQAVLETVKFQYNNDIVHGLKTQLQGEIVSDFIILAKDLKEKGYKESSAVLASAALEDCLKKYAERNGLNVSDNDLQVTVNALKGQKLLAGVQSGIIDSYIKLRNKAFHSQFDKIDMPEVASLITFVEEFLSAKFK